MEGKGGGIPSALDPPPEIARRDLQLFRSPRIRRSQSSSAQPIRRCQCRFQDRKNYQRVLAKSCQMKIVPQPRDMAHGGLKRGEKVLEKPVQPNFKTKYERLIGGSTKSGLCNVKCLHEATWRRILRKAWCSTSP